MQSAIESLNGLTRKINITVPKEQIDNDFNSRIKELAKDANVKGFRKGKVPTSIVKIQYGDIVKKEVIEAVIWETLQAAFKEHNVNAASTPHIEIKTEAPLVYEATFEIFPDIKLNLDGISVEKPNTTVEKSNVDDVIEKLRTQNMKWQEVDREAQKGDQVIIDFEGYIDDVAFEGGSAHDFKLELGRGNMIPGFEDPIIGLKAGENVEVNVTFPEDYHAKQHAGKPAKFNVTVNKVMAGELPPLDDAFAADLGVNEGTLEGLRKEVGNNLEREVERRLREKVKIQIIDQLLEKNMTDVPKAAVEEEVNRLLEQMKRQFSMQTGLKEAPDLPRENFEEQAKKNVLLGLLLSQWIQDNDIKVDSTRVRERIDQIASGYHHPHEIINWYYGNKDALNEIEAAVLEDQAIDKLLDAVEVTDKDVAFDELMNTSMQEDEK